MDSDSFALNINNIGDADRTFYTCVTYHSSGQTTFDVTRIKIHGENLIHFSYFVIIFWMFQKNMALECGSHFFTRQSYMSST